MSKIAGQSVPRHQFVISRMRIAGYPCYAGAGFWSVGYDQGYALTKILDARGESIGIFLGAVIDFSSNAFKPASVTIAWQKGQSRKALEDSLYERAGSWIAVIATDGFQSIYLDACGSLPLVYSKDRQVAASSAHALLDDESYFDDLFEEAKSETWFRLDRYHTAGLTAHRSLKRLLPNHQLDLEDWTAKRVWPVEPFPALSVEQVVAEVADASRKTIEVAMTGGPALMPLTAGNETRALLSLTKGRESEMVFFTGSFPGAVVDLGVARRIARKFHLSHVTTIVRPRTENEIRNWRLQTGHCIGGAICYSRMDRRNIAESQVEFSGAAGEVGRGFLWAASDTAGDRLTSDVLLARLKLPLIGRFVTAVDAWLKTVEQFDAFTIMDLAYIELKMACWAGPQAPGTEAEATQVWPLSSRACFTAMISAPPKVRLEQSLFVKIVGKQWPELLQIPINKGTAWENMQKLFYRASSPRRVWNKIRKNLAKMKPAKDVV